MHYGMYVKGMGMSVRQREWRFLDLRPPPTCSKTARVKISLFKKIIIYVKKTLHHEIPSHKSSQGSNRLYLCMYYVHNGIPLQRTFTQRRLWCMDSLYCTAAISTKLRHLFSMYALPPTSFDRYTAYIGSWWNDFDWKPTKKYYVPHATSYHQLQWLPHSNDSEQYQIIPSSAVPTHPIPHPGLPIFLLSTNCHGGMPSLEKSSPQHPLRPSRGELQPTFKLWLHVFTCTL